MCNAADFLKKMFYDDGYLDAKYDRPYNQLVYVAKEDIRSAYTNGYKDGGGTVPAPACEQPMPSSKGKKVA
jgi:hypothetical protein